MRVQNCNQPVLPAASHQCNQKLSVGMHHFSACGQQRSLKNLCLIFCRNFNLTSAHNCRPVPDTKRKKLCFNRYMWIWKKKNWSSRKTSNFRGKGSEGDFLSKFFGMFCEIFSVLESSDPLRCGWESSTRNLTSLFLKCWAVSSYNYNPVIGNFFTILTLYCAINYNVSHRSHLTLSLPRSL